MTDTITNFIRISDILREKNLTMKDLAAKLNSDGTKNEGSIYSYIHQIANNQKFPRPEKLREIANALDVDIRELFYSTKNELPNLKVDNLKEFGTPIYKKDIEGNFIQIGLLNN